MPPETTQVQVGLQDEELNARSLIRTQLEPAMEKKEDLNDELTGDDILPSSKSRPKRTPGVRANHRRGRGNDSVARNSQSKRPSAQKHGVHSACPTIPGEDPREFQELHSALEYQPSGPSEADTRGGRQQGTRNKPAPATESRKKNALIHGIYGKDILLPWESREDFEKLLAELQDEFQPRGRMKNEIVFDVAHLRLQKDRVHQMCIAAAHADPFVSDLVKAGQKSWAGIRNHLKSTAQDERMMSELRNQLFLEQTAEAAETIAELIETGKVADSATKTSETRKRDANAVRIMLKDFTIPLIETFEDRPKAEDSLRRAYSPEYLEPIIRLEAMIDTRIDKALQRLANLKEYKRYTATYDPPLISTDASTSANLTDIAALPEVGNDMNDNLRE
jgi:hypothetical protein